MHSLRTLVFEANLALVDSGLVVLTWGNASGIDREHNLVWIKPSGVDYATMKPDDMVAVDLTSGKTVYGTLRPSSDLPTHLALYQAWPDIGGVVHTHSPCGTSFAQAGRAIPCYGTTHADFCPGPVQCIRALEQGEVEEGYESNTGKAIIEHYARHHLHPLEYPGALLTHHGPFTWGKNASAAVENAIILENIAAMAQRTEALNPTVQPIPDYIIEKHYSRKHGPNAYYGQK